MPHRSIHRWASGAVLSGGMLAGGAQAAPLDVDALAAAPPEAFVEAFRHGVSGDGGFVLLFSRVDPAFGPPIERLLTSPSWILLERDLIECLYREHAAVGAIRLLARSFVHGQGMGQSIRADPDMTIHALLGDTMPDAFVTPGLTPAEIAIEDAAYERCFGELDVAPILLSHEFAAARAALPGELFLEQAMPSDDLPDTNAKPEPGEGTE